MQGITFRYTVTRLEDGAVVQQGFLTQGDSRTLTLAGIQVYKGGSRLALEAQGVKVTVNTHHTLLESGADKVVVEQKNKVSANGMDQPETSENSTPAPKANRIAWFHQPNSPRWKGMPIAVAMPQAVWWSQSA